jgi:hypothetical protein
MPSDYHLRNFAYAGLSFPSETPFFPVIFNDTGTLRKVKFNQGYVFDYQSYGESGVEKIAVSMEEEYPAEGKFYVKISTSAKDAAVANAELIKGETNAGKDWHYSADNIGDNINVYTTGLGNFQIPVCSFDTNGNLENVYLRENIHWQKINFANNPKPSGPAQSLGVLYNWGDGKNFDSPTVKFGRIEQKKSDGIFPEGKEKFIKIEKSLNQEGDIVVTTQLPEILDDETSVLVRKKENEWDWVNPIKEYTSLFVYNGETQQAEFFDVHNGCFFYVKDNQLQMLPHPNVPPYADPVCLKHNGVNPFWAACGSPPST